MDHVCLICNSPFLLEGSDTYTETVATSCGHVFHRDCIAGHAAMEGATCLVCRTTLHEGNKFKKIFVSYDDGEHDKVLLNDVKQATSTETQMLADDSNIDDLQEHLENLREENLYNQVYIEGLDVEWSAIQALCELQGTRLKCIGQKIASLEGRRGGRMGSSGDV